MPEDLSGPNTAVPYLFQYVRRWAIELLNFPAAFEDIVAAPTQMLVRIQDPDFKPRPLLRQRLHQRLGKR